MLASAGGDRLQQAQGAHRAARGSTRPFLPVPLVTAAWPLSGPHCPATGCAPSLGRDGSCPPQGPCLEPPRTPRRSSTHPAWGREGLLQEAKGPPSGGDGRPFALGVTGVMGSPSPHPGHPHPTAAAVTSHVPFHGRWHSHFLGAAQPLGSGSRPPISCHKATEPVPRPQEATARRCEVTQDPAPPSLP